MILLNLLFAIICLKNSSFTNANAKKSVFGKLIEKVDTQFDCGIIKVGVVNKFVIVENNKETEDTIKVVCICPEGYGRDFFKVNNLYTLTIDNNLDSLKDCYILDKFPSQKLKVWVLQTIKKYG